MERDRWAQLAAASRPRRDRLLGIRRVVVWLGDLLVDLGCLLQARYAPEPSATAC